MILTVRLGESWPAAGAASPAAAARMSASFTNAVNGRAPPRSGDVRAKRRVIQPAGAATKGEQMTDLDDYARWLRSLPRRGAYHALSPHRPYETAEEAYDRDAAPSLYAGELLTGMLAEVAPRPFRALPGNWLR